MHISKRLPYFKPLALVLCGLFSSACYHSIRTPQVATVSVTTTPPNASVWQEDATGKRALGTAPMVYRRDYQRVTRRFRYLPSWLTTVGLVGATAGSIAWYHSTESGSGALPLTAAILTGIVAGSALLTTTIASFYPQQDMTPKVPLTIGASLPGYADAYTKLTVPGAPKALALELPAGGTAAAKAGAAMLASMPIAAATPRRPIVAVFPIEYGGSLFQAEATNALTEYLATQLASTGKFRVIPRSQLRRRLATTKKSGYKACYDEACQIELGKALAAQKSLATKILVVGKVCAITSVLYDLKTETSERAASAESGCSMVDLLKALRSQAQQLGAPPKP